MRSCSSVARCFVTFGLGLFVCALSLFPTAALADTIEVRLDGYRLRIFENTSIYYSGFTQLNQSGTVAKYFTKYVYDDDSMTGLIDPNYSYTDPSISRVYDYSVSLNDTNAYGYEVYRSETFSATSGSVDNSFIGLLVDLGGTVISKNQTLRVMLPSSGFQFEAQNSTTSSTRYNITLSVASVYSGTNQNSLSRATNINGAWQVAANSSMVLIVFSSSGRGASYLNGAHSYVMFGCPRLFLNVPSADATAINQQSVQNTNRMMDTTGSNTVASDMVGQYSNTYENMNVVQQLGTLATNLQATLNTSETTSITFPGLSLMGFEIPQQVITIPDKMVGLLDTIKFITTFCFVVMFFRYLHAFIGAVFGTEDVGLWVAREEVMDGEGKGGLM